ncbi:MAG: hypothetical protein A2087_01620 [Spirochaetes bacterium GWD1_61_31]|nr:MAG: hypothetical protein A2Y37_10465 [Spirochaetes bacterium GWB1_60_80]OHD29747.1 MAG: hypothetical protein A2004_04740 [Spirochaetes bacterium GWC1_61_12]OHD35773.1 MAG: hypothetical protein A2087_01620 [Spirochaetes bacterium GWD1_61_31]OHD42910.1 MAG: hypothetical protein A2Y35_14055 [Spirochaetes bacterium GWE1_60_18]OHD61290.1 MAG: hypothetical protein A2Y32_04160 [Spirochaetes bacterium GWF1_60_12]HAP43778.1 molybdopterin oxidoreductase [Spirochaetaceae bacterium]
MSEELICITCPLGCHLTIERRPDNTLGVSGNRCARGVRYACEELLSPKRMVTATVRICRPFQAEAAACGETGLGSVARLPVRTSQAYPKEGVAGLLADIYRLEVTVPVKRGTVLLADYKGSGIDIIAARSLQV